MKIFNRRRQLDPFLPFEDKVQDLTVDLKELISRKVCETTINKIVFRLKNDLDKNKQDTSSILWNQFVNDLKEYNDLEKIHKTDTKFKSKYGKSIVGFDIYNKKPIIWFGDAGTTSNQSIRINGMQEYALVIDRTYSTMNGGAPILKNQLIYTNTTISYLFQGGFGVQTKDLDAINKINSSKKELQKQKEMFVPVQWANLKVPKYIADSFKTGTFKHKMGVLPCTEMLNKDFIDNEGYAFETSTNSFTDEMYADWYVAKDLIELYNYFIQFVSGEMVLDHTRIIGSFSQQDMNALSGKNKSARSKFSLFTNNRIEVEEQPETQYVKQKLILRSIGGENSTLEKMQTTFKALEYIDSFDKLSAYIFKVCGYSWDTDSVSTYENVSQTMNSSKGVYETTKAKISLFERQWKDFYSKIAFSYFKFHNLPFSSITDARKEFEENIDFQIVSNVLQQENNDYQKVVELSNSGLISKTKALKDLNPEMSNEDIAMEIERISEEETKKNDFNFQNDFLGFEENENPAVNGEVEGEE